MTRLRKGIMIAAPIAAALIVISAAVLFNMSKNTFGSKFDKDMLRYDNAGEQTLLIHDNELYTYIPEKEMYTVLSIGEDGRSYRTFLDKRGDACFVASDDGGGIYIDYPNDGKDAVLYNSETLESIENLEAYNFYDYMPKQTFTIKSEYHLYSEPAIKELTEKDAQKIEDISVIHDSAIKHFSENIK